MKHIHDSFQEGCFGCKLRTLRFQPPSERVVNEDAIRDTFGDEKENMEYARDITDGIGYLRWSKGEPYKKRWLDGTWEKATDADLNRTLFGRAKLKEEETRSF